MQYCQKTEKRAYLSSEDHAFRGKFLLYGILHPDQNFSGFFCIYFYFFIFYFLFFLNFLFSTVHKGDRQSQQNHTRNTGRKKLNSAEKTKRRTCCIFSSVENLKILPAFYSWWKRNVKKYLP